jgi:2'-hydroxyisoflavone reductase
MRLLILGGTLFLGRHLAEEALGRGHAVTLFNRCRTAPELFPEAEQLRGDRHGDLDALRGREWDAVIDTSGRDPRAVGATTLLLASSIGHYIFVSSISAYGTFHEPGIDEDTPTANATSARPLRRSLSRPASCGDRRRATCSNPSSASHSSRLGSRNS